MNDNTQEEYPRFNDPLPGSRPEESDMPAPPVIMWYRAYCLLATVLAVGGVAIAGARVLFHTHIDLPKTPDLPGMDDVNVGTQSLLLMAISILYFGINLTALLLPRRPWAWLYHLVNIALGLGNIIAIPLLVFWLKPETQIYYGREVESVAQPDSEL